MGDADYLDETRIAYDTVATNYAAQLRDELAGNHADRAHLDAFAADVDGWVADIGCGPGRVSGYLASRGLRVIGLDLSPAMIAIARAEYPTLQFEVGSMLDLPFANGSLGGIVAWYSIIHVPPDEHADLFAGFHAVMAPGGLLLLAFQVGDERRRVTQGYGHEVSLDAYRLRPERVSELLVEAGFDIRSVTVREPTENESVQQAFVLAEAVHSTERLL